MRNLFLTLLFTFSISFTYAQTITGTPAFCEGGSTVLTVTGAPTPATFQWQRSTDGGTTWNDIPGATTSSYTADIAASYKVAVEGKFTDPVAVVVHPKPTPNFTFDNDNACSGTQVQFTSSVTTGTAPFTYAWEFGDGSTSAAQNPTHAFTSLGCATATFTIKLTVTDAKGCVNSISKMITVKQAPDVDIIDQNVFAPFSNCDKNPTPGNARYTLTIDNNSRGIACITTYSINWGDGSPLQQNVTFPVAHTYTEVGAYDLVVTATGSNGCIGSKKYVVANQSNPAGSLGTLGSTTGLCAPANVPFTISNWQLNSAGTTYRLDFGDGTITTFKHPLNAGLTEATVNHVYTTSSCPSPTFTARLDVINACATTPYSAGNIQVRIKPSAAFTTPASICTGSNITFTNTTATGYSGNNCSTLSIYEWDFGDGTKSGSANGAHSYTTPGTYKVTLTATNPCGTSTFTKDVCVVAPPVSSFTLSASAGCGPVTVNTTNASTGSSDCAAATHQWSVSYAAAHCGTTASWSFLNNTSSTSIAPSFLFTNPGTYTISHTITNGCRSVSSNQVINVYRPPVISMASIPTNCSPKVTPSATVTNCGPGNVSYEWSFPGASPSTSTSSSPGQIVYSTAGTYTISLTVKNDCGATTVTQQVTIRPSPATPVIEPISPVCSGSTIELKAASTTQGVTYAWTGPDNYSNTNQNISLAKATPAMSGTYTITATLNGCASSASINVVVNIMPPAPSVVSQVDYCVNATASALTASTSPGNSLKWYTVAVGGTALSSAPVPATNASGTVTYYVSQLNANGTCESGRAAVTVNVNEVPVILGNSTNPTNCTAGDGKIVLSGLIPNTSYIVRYSRNNGTPVNTTILSDVDKSLTIASLTAATYSGITVSLKGCSSNEAGPFTIVNPTAPQSPTATGNGPLCSGAVLKLTSISSTSGVSYAWTGPSGFNSTTQNPELLNATVQMSGNYTVTATLNGCTSVPATVNVIISQTPANPMVTSQIAYCQGATASALTAVASAGNSLKWYTDLNGQTPLPEAPVPVTAVAGNNTYYVAQVNNISSCESQRSSITVNIKPAPVLQATSSDPTSCISSNGIIKLSALIPGTSYRVSYIKNGGAPVTETYNTDTSGEININNLSAGVYSAIKVTLNGCASNAVGPFTLTNPAAPVTPTASGNGPICSGQNLQLLSASTSAGATYIWSGPGGFTSNQQNPVRNNATAAMTGTYSVKATLNGCISSAGQVKVTINQTPAAPALQPAIEYCQDANAVPLTAAASTGNALLWYTNAIGGSALPAAPTPVTSTAGTFTWYVSQSSPASCESGRTAVTVAVKAVARISGFAADPVNCSAPDGTIVLSGLAANTSYLLQYTKDNGSPTSVSLTSDASGNVSIINLSAGSYSQVKAIYNGCVSNSAGPFILNNPAPPASPVIATNSPLCAGSTLSLNTSTSFPGVVYAWTGPAGFTSNQQNPSINNTGTASGGKYQLTVARNGCLSAPSVIEVFVHSPNVVTAGSNSSLCVGSTLFLTANSTSSSALSYYWTGPNGFSSKDQYPVITNAKSLHSGTYTVSVTTNQANCSTSKTTDVLISEIPVISGVSYVEPVNCSPVPGSITLNGLKPLTLYKVHYTKNGSVPFDVTMTTDNTGGVALKNLTGGTYSNISVSLNGCNSNIVGPLSFMQTVPAPAKPFATANGPLCSGSTIILNATTPPGEPVTYYWTGPNNFSSNVQKPFINNADKAASGKYFVYVKSRTCTSEKDSVDVQVGDYPLVNIGDDLTLPSGTQHQFNPVIQNGPVSYMWSPATYLSCVNCPTPLASVQSNISYVLKVSNNFGCTATDTINLKVICDKANIFIPDAFTPDGDGLNDLFMVRSALTVNVKYLRIFNKWGQLVFEKMNFTTNDVRAAWDGKVKGVSGPPDVFVYVAEVQCDRGATFTYKGNVTLLK